jgi:hypothetical protein
MFLLRKEREPHMDEQNLLMRDGRFAAEFREVQ